MSCTPATTIAVASHTFRVPAAAAAVGGRRHGTSAAQIKHNDRCCCCCCWPTGGLLEGLRALRVGGEITHVSLGMCCSQDGQDPPGGLTNLILRLICEAPAGTFDSAMLAYGWNLANQYALPILLECQARGIEVHPAGVFHFGGYGILFDPSKTDDTVLLEKHARWLELATKHGFGLGAVAVGFASLPAVIGKVVLGMASPEEVALNIDSIEEAAAIPSRLWHDARAAGLIDSAVPLPPL